MIYSYYGSRQQQPTIPKTPKPMPAEIRTIPAVMAPKDGPLPAPTRIVIRPTIAEIKPKIIRIPNILQR